MTRIRRSKNNPKYFEVIPRPKGKQLYAYLSKEEFERLAESDEE